jgi:hypothetical protein
MLNDGNGMLNVVTVFYLIFQNIKILRQNFLILRLYKQDGEFFMKTQSIKMFIGLLILAFAAFGSACSFGKATAQNQPGEPKIVRAAEPTPTPYKPLKRVSRDIIKDESKPETVKIKAKQ